MHYNCTTLAGVPLEDEGGSGSAKSHWEKTVVNTDVKNIFLIFFFY